MPDGKDSAEDRRPRRQAKKKAAPLGNLLSNPAFAGAEDIVDHSIFGASPDAVLPQQPGQPITPGANGADLQAPPAPATQPEPTTPAAVAALGQKPAPATPEPDATAPSDAAPEADKSTTPAPQRGSSSDAKPKGESRRKRPKEPTEAHRALAHSWTESTLDLMLGTKAWAAVPVRLTNGLAEAITSRMADDTEATGKRMTQAHYVDAAFRRHLPSTLEEQVQLAEGYLRSGRAGTTGKQSTYRLGPDVAQVVRALPMDMKRAGRSRTAVHVYSAAVQKLLDELENDGPLIWPEETEGQ